jgi:4-diphosphocytidyl-2-C-methyl-D-erythritol kinase
VTLELLAPAKLNLALEIVGRRPDGYHEIVSVIQSLDLCDRVRLSDAPVLEMDLEGEELRGVPREGPRNLAFAAGQALADAAGKPILGAHIELEKHIPAGMGLGGGSADAAAVLRGLNRLWRLGLSDAQLCEVGARVGSDVPACIVAGACLVTGRGERVEALPDGLEEELTVFVPDVAIENKTQRMYGMVEPNDYTDGHKARVLAESVRRGLPLATPDFVNAFDRHVRAAVKATSGAMALCRDASLPVLACGSGPGFFSLTPLTALPPMLARELDRDWGVHAIGCRTLGRAEARAIREV